MIINVIVAKYGVMEEILLLKQCAKEYGVGLDIINVSSKDPVDRSGIIIGNPAKTKGMAGSRPVTTKDGHTIVRIPLILPEADEKRQMTLDEFHYGMHIAFRHFSGEGFSDYGDWPGYFKYKSTNKLIINMVAMSDRVRCFYFDLETTGFDPIVDKMNTISVTPEFKNGKIGKTMTYHGDDASISNVLKAFVNHGLPVGAYNAKFEQKWVHNRTGNTANLVRDPQVDYALLHENGLKNLDIASMKVGWHGYSLPMREFLQPVNHVRRVPTAKYRKHHEADPLLLCDYNAKDTYVTALLGQYTKTLLEQEPGGEMPDVADWLYRGQSMLARMENAGMKVNKKILLKEANSHAKKSAKINKVVMDAAKKEGLIDFNPNSSPQMVALLFDKLDYPIMYLTNKKWVHISKYKKGWHIGKGNPSSSSIALKMIKEKVGEDELIDALLERGSMETVRNTFLSNFENAVAGGDGNMRSNFSATKLVTGQLSSTQPPMQNIPKEPIRRIFTSRFKNGSIAEIDYSQLHLRIIGNLAQCPGFIEAYGGGVDLHSRTAAKVIANITETEFLDALSDGLKHAKDDRDTAKRTNFSIIFEIGANALASKTGRMPEECKVIIDSWFGEYPEIKTQIERQHDYAKARGYIISPFGRVRHLPNAKSLNNSLHYRAMRQAGDFKISNSGRYITYYGMIGLDEDMTDMGMASKMVLQVHDSIVLDIHPKEVEDVIDLVQKHMIVNMMDLCCEWMDPIELEMDGFMGPNWYVGDATHSIELTLNETKIESVA